MPKKKQIKEEKNTGDSKTFAFLATFLSIVGFIIALLVKKDDKYVMYYAKQSLVVFIAYIVAGAVMIVPIVGWVAGPVIYMIVTVLWIISWVYALSGKMKPTPIIGQYADKINL